MKNCITFGAVLLFMGGFSATSMAESYNDVCVPIRAQIVPLHTADICYASPLPAQFSGLFSGDVVGGKVEFTVSDDMSESVLEQPGAGFRGHLT